MNDEVRILLVDDEVPLRQTFTIFLNRAGYSRVVEAGSLAEALAAVDEEEFDLVISDIVLEADSGIDLLRELRQRGIEVPVVIITGYPSIDTAAEAVRLGAFDYLTKPVKKDRLLEVTRRALAAEAVRQQQAARATADQEHQVLLASLPEMVVALDGNGGVLEANEPARRWLQQYLPAFLQRGLTDDARDHPLLAALAGDWRHVLRHRQPVAEHRVEWRHGDDLMVVGVGAAPMDGGVVFTLRDPGPAASLADDAAGEPVPGMVGQSAVMRRLFTRIRRVAPVDVTVLITGESGTGKGVAARALHQLSRRAAGPFVQVDCASLPEELLESELFGHRRGAFTGAERDRAGRILQAEGGTLFLDEIGDISVRTQLRLLRFLQSRLFYPVGHDKPVKVDVRVIAATNADLPAKVAAGEFREDLYYRLRVVDLEMPPLRRRSEDIPLLVQHFLAACHVRPGQGELRCTERAMSALCAYHWPGNVRELAHVIERAAVFCDNGVIRTTHLPAEVVAALRGEEPVALPPTPAATEPDDSVDEARRLIMALRRTGGNKAKAARLLGVDRSTIYRKLQAYAIDPDQFRVDNAAKPL